MTTNIANTISLILVETLLNITIVLHRQTSRCIARLQMSITAQWFLQSSVRSPDDLASWETLIGTILLLEIHRAFIVKDGMC